MSSLPFACTAAPLSAAGFQSALTSLGIDAATLWAMMAVETPGCGYLVDRRPQILFERHIFSRLTGGQYDQTNPDISNPVGGGYGAGGAAQYARLAEAVVLDQDHALESASWGLGQVLGTNYTSLHYASVDAMVADMCATEDAQLAAVVGFVVTNRLATALQNQQWATYASGYNGHGYAANHYDTRLASHYSYYIGGGAMPDLNIRAAQVYLEFLGYDPKGIDGVLGAGTLTALHNFQSDQGLTLTPTVDDSVVASLSAALPAASDLTMP